MQRRPSSEGEVLAMTPEERAARLAEIRESVRDWVGTVPAECGLWPPRVRFVLGLLDDARAELQRVEAERDEFKRAGEELNLEVLDAKRQNKAALARAEKAEA
jgi:hypothetical protein